MDPRATPVASVKTENIIKHRTYMQTLMQQITEANIAINHCRFIIKQTNDMERRKRAFRILKEFVKRKRLLMEYLH